MAGRVANLPNAITLLRAALIPVIAYALAMHDYRMAFVLFVLQGLSDFVDGWIARRWNLRTRFGAIADPLADKLTMLTATLMLAAGGLLPVWLALAIVVRDVIIVFGALAYHFLIRELELSPTPLSKWNTALEFAVLAAVLADAGGLIDGRGGLQAAFALLAATIVASGAQYVWIWGRRARAGRSRP